MSTDEEFMAVIGDILSAQHVAIHATADGWQALATAGGGERDRFAGVAGDTESEPGVGLPELAERLRGTAEWADGASAVAHRIAGQLRQAGDASARATERALTLLLEYEEARVELPADEVSPEMVSAAARAREEQERLLAEAKQLLQELSREFGRVTGGEPPASPEQPATYASLEAQPRMEQVGAPLAVDRYGPPGPPADRPNDPDAPDAPDGKGPDGKSEDNLIEGTPPPSVVQTYGGEEYPSYLATLGPENGEFSGWVRSPTTGYLVDPATGREFDPGSARWIDPVTGLPFGEATEYATRLSGLGTGPGAMATGVALAPTGGGGAVGGAGLHGGAVGGAGGLAGLYGGVLPPSVAHPGPAQPQVVREALQNLRRRATVAGQFAAREAAQLGRQVVPPPAAISAAGRTGGGTNESGRAGRPSDLTEDPEVWSVRRTAARDLLGD